MPKESHSWYDHHARTEYPAPYKVHVPADLHERFVTVPLACGHTNDFPQPAPQVGASAYCRRCAAYTRVKAL